MHNIEHSLSTAAAESGILDVCDLFNSPSIDRLHRNRVTMGGSSRDGASDQEQEWAMNSSEAAKPLTAMLAMPARTALRTLSAFADRLPGMQIPAGQEATYHAYKARRLLKQRRMAALSALVAWLAFVYWDYQHWADWHDAVLGTYRPQTLVVMLAIRFVGASLIAVFAYRLWTRPSFALDDGATQRGCIALILYVWFATLAIMALTPPQNVLIYYDGLPLVYLFLFCLLGITPGRAAGAGLLCLAAFILTAALQLGSEQLVAPASAGVPQVQRTRYHIHFAVFYVIGFYLMGSYVAYQIESLLRTTFLREREIEASNDALTSRNRALAQSNQALDEARIDTENKTAALIAAKEELRRRAEQESHDKSRFLAAAAHDLRQPMQALATLLEAARGAASADAARQARSHIELAQTAARVLGTSLNAVLDLSRLESGFVKPVYAIFDVDALVQELLVALEPLAGDRGVTMRVRRSASLPLIVRSDPQMLARAISNLVSNAIKYADPERLHPAVLIGLVRLPNRVRIDVIDNGIGIPRERWDDVFKPFVQLDNPERDRDKGMGLGLSVVNAAVHALEEHRLDMHSTVGCGTRFSLDVPLAPAGDRVATEMPADAASGSGSIAGRYVLLVEDDLLVRRATAALLAQAGALVEQVGTLEELRRLLDTLERHPDLLVSDYRLPVGATACDVMEIVRAALDDDVPTLILTGELDLPASIPRALPVLRKPVAPGALLDAIRKALNL